MGQTASNLVRKVIGGGGGQSSPSTSEESLKAAVVPFVFKRRGSLYRDEDGQLAHEFYEEVKDRETKKTKMRRKYGNLTPQGDIELQIPRLHVDLPVIMCEVFPR